MREFLRDADAGRFAAISLEGIPLASEAVLEAVTLASRGCQAAKRGTDLGAPQRR